ncbi:hypothetical protein [Acrocarpospora sp. B8E8]|uniref:hypothetical protein n=1 Tax=Acrocarpospora sp. B8E8 TaxID=3153572 RepID=UPI00325F6429
MGMGRRASAISAGALALALGGGIPLLAAGSARAADCNSQGPLSGVANSLCQVVDGVTDVVDGVTGGTLSTVTDTLDSTVSGVTNGAGNAGRTVSASPAPTPSGGSPESSTPSTPPSHSGGLGETVRAVCLPLLAGPECDEKPSTQPRPRASKSPKPRPTASESDSGGGTLPTDPPKPPENRPQFLEDGDGDPVPSGEPDGDGMVIRIEDAEVPLLWPGQLVPALTGETRGASARPRQPYDPVGTALTAVLLLSAVLATRVVASRRAREKKDEPDGLPLSGLPMTTGRHHRLA